MHRVRLSLVFAAIFLAALLPHQLLAREGFGFSKKAAKLNRIVPPEVYLAGDTIEVRVSEKGSGETTSKFRDLVEAKLIGFEGRLKVDSSTPDYVVGLQLGDSNFQESWEPKTSTEYKQTGTKQEWNAKKGRYETKPVYGDVTVYKNFKRVRATVSARFTAMDRQKNETIHDGAVHADYDETFENGAGSPAQWDIEQQLLEKAAGQVAAKLVGSTEPVAALLPRGSFEAYVSFAEQGAWERYFRGVENVAEKSRPAEEAYRQYALGLANEAMAYQQDDPSRALDYLRAAESCYQRATRLRPEEKFFTEPYANVWTGGKSSSPIERVTSGISNYARLKDFRAMPRPAELPAQFAKASLSSTMLAKKKSGESLQNATLIEMTRAGLSEENIILAVESAPATEFDLSADGLIALSRAGVSKNVIAYIQKREK